MCWTWAGHSVATWKIKRNDRTGLKRGSKIILISRVNGANGRFNIHEIKWSHVTLPYTSKAIVIWMCVYGWIYEAIQCGGKADSMCAYCVCACIAVFNVWECFRCLFDSHSPLFHNTNRDRSWSHHFIRFTRITKQTTRSGISTLILLFIRYRREWCWLYHLFCEKRHTRIQQRFVLVRIVQPARCTMFTVHFRNIACIEYWVCNTVHSFWNCFSFYLSYRDFNMYIHVMRDK